MALLKGLSQLSLPAKPTTANAWLASYDISKKSFQAARSFQYYPEQLLDNRSVNIEEKYGIGSSHPIYQWVRGSSRDISFDAVFTSEDRSENPSNISNTLNQIRSAIKNPATALTIARNKSKAADLKHTQDIPSAINWLRSFTYPTYSNSKTTARVKAPPICALWLENSGISSFVGSFEADIVTCIMTKCDVNYEAFFNNGTPRVVTVSLQFVETIQIGDNWKYVNGQNIADASSGYVGPTGGTKNLQGKKAKKILGSNLLRRR